MASDAKILATLTEDFLKTYFNFYPTSASSLGLHEYDGRISDLSKEAVANFVKILHSYHERLKKIDSKRLAKLEAFDYGLLQWKIEAELWEWTERREYLENPMFYSYFAMVDGYVMRDYAPLAERAKSLTQHLTQLPQFFTVAKQNLKAKVPRILIEEAMPVFAGLSQFIQNDVIQAFEQLDATLHQELKAACAIAETAIKDFCTFLETTLLPTAQTEFALGPTLFAALLRYNELVDLPLVQLLALGEADLTRNQAAIVAVAKQLNPTQTVAEQMKALGENHPEPDQLIPETKKMLEHLRAFLLEHDLVTLPTDVKCQVAETPPFARWAFAMIDTAGAFEEIANDSFYYITLPEPDWPPEKTAGWLTKFDFATMTGISIHEAYPGHFVHFAHVRHAPTQLAKSFSAYTHYEGWAHYVEQMMLDEGYGENALHLRMAQLAEALVRNCRYVCAIKMHTQGMQIEEATQFFIENAYMDEVTASKEARRGTHDPGYLNYTLGKLALFKLLGDYRAAQGPLFSLKNFHDAFIGYGSPPIPLLRSLLLSSDDGIVV